MTGPLVVFHANAGLTFGMGHLMRCLTLAEEASRQGWRTAIVGDLDAQARDIIDRSPFDGAVVEILMARQKDGLRAAVIALQPGVVHIDSYWPEAGLLTGGPFVVSNMQDGEFGLRASDLAIDANLGAEWSFERPELSTYHLAGGSVAVVREQVRRQRGAVANRTGERRVLVVLGGTDPHRLTATVVRALDSVEEHPVVTVIAPASVADVVAETAAQVEHAVTVLPFVDDLPALARAQDLVISAAGTSVWDFACMGAPMALVCVTENQLRGFAASVGAGVAIGLSRPPHDRLDAAVRELGPLLSDDGRLRSLSEAGMAAIDGHGAWRIVTAWHEIFEPWASAATAQPIVDVRPAQPGDARVLFDWRNDPLTRAVSRASAPLVWEDHVAWFTGVLADAHRLLLVGESGKGPIGTVRWDRGADIDWEVSIAVAPMARGGGYGGALLAAAEQALRATAPGPLRLVAAIHEANAASRRLFRRAGYLPFSQPDEDGFLRVAKLALPTDSRG